jgi:plasmid stability protein
MPVTLTIKQVPDRIAQKLRSRAAASHRSLQGELMAILEEAALQGAMAAGEPEAAPYVAKRKRAAKPAASGRVAAHGKRLTLSELWERSRRLGPRSKSESTAIIRALRDERHGR